jgi:hypothetical protein
MSSFATLMFAQVLLLLVDFMSCLFLWSLIQWVTLLHVIYCVLHDCRIPPSRMHTRSTLSRLRLPSTLPRGSISHQLVCNDAHIAFDCRYNDRCNVQMYPVPSVFGTQPKRSTFSSTSTAPSAVPSAVCRHCIICVHRHILYDLGLFRSLLVAGQQAHCRVWRGPRRVCARLPLG